jgi:biopolymer transport protein ExbB/TolQ
MNMAFDILVITLGCLLGILLILSIIAAVLILRLVSALRQIVAKGEQLVDSAEAISETLKRNAGAVSIVRLLLNMLGNMSGTKHRKG